jgi:hypothetical protein
MAFTARLKACPDTKRSSVLELPALTVLLLGDDAAYDEDAAFGCALPDGLDGVVGVGIPPFAGLVCAIEGDYYQAAFWGFAFERLELATADYEVCFYGFVSLSAVGVRMGTMGGLSESRIILG